MAPLVAWAIKTEGGGLRLDMLFASQLAAQERKTELDRRTPMYRGRPVIRHVVRVVVSEQKRPPRIVRERHARMVA